MLAGVQLGGCYAGAGMPRCLPHKQPLVLDFGGGLSRGRAVCGNALVSGHLPSLPGDMGAGFQGGSEKQRRRLRVSYSPALGLTWCYFGCILLSKRAQRCPRSRGEQQIPPLGGRSATDLLPCITHHSGTGALCAADPSTEWLLLSTPHPHLLFPASVCVVGGVEGRRPSLYLFLWPSPPSPPLPLPGSLIFWLFPRSHPWTSQQPSQGPGAGDCSQ